MSSTNNATSNTSRWQSNLSIAEQAIAEAGQLSRISELRNEIDGIDGDIARLLAERLSIVQKIGDLKSQAKLPVLDNVREVEVLRRAKDATSDPASKESLEAIFRVIMEQSRKLQARQKSEKARLTFPNVLVIGVGLIGGAFIRQIKRTLPDTSVFGCDEPIRLLPVFEEGLIDKGDLDSVGLLPEASLIVLASSPDTNIQHLKKIAPHLKRGQLVIDVTSTKTTICRLAEHLDLNGAEFIGGHPFMGSEKQGFSASSEVKADGAVFCLSPTSKSSEVSIGRITRWLCDLNFQVEIMDAQTHDLVAARISHLVQMVAVAMGSSMRDSLTDDELKTIPGISGKTFRELRRLMNSPADMWFEISQQNAAELVNCVNDLRLKLWDIAQAIDTGDDTKLKQHFERASQIP